MNAAQIHLGLNHLPISFALVGVFLLAIALWRRSEEVKVAASGLLILGAILCVPVYLTGEPAEELVEHRAGVLKANIHEHEDAAKFAFGASLILGGLAFAALAFERFKRPLARGAWWGIVLFGIFSMSIFIRTAHLGGLIRHEEIGQR